MSVIRPGYWDPWDLRDELYAWWNADDYGSSLMTDDGLGRISSWKDRKYRINLTAATTARPTYGATAFNGAKKALAFDGTANTLATTDLSLIPTADVPCEVWALFDFTAPFGTAQARNLFSWGGLSGATRRLMNLQNTTAPLFNVGNGATNTINYAGTAPDLYGKFAKIIGARWSGTVQNARYDGRPSLVGDTTVASLATGTSRFRLGSNNANTAGNFFYGPIRQFLITKILSASNRLRMEGWLAWDGGVQAVLP